tara:strand:+ start:144 stop:635 length:492 start_codon:yes stop_codon:yes gene_type:complete
MEQDKYLKNIERVRAWMQENDAGALGVVIDGMVNLSPETNEEREANWVALRALGKNLPNTFVKRGRASAMPAEVEVAIDAISAAHGASMAEMWLQGDNRYLLRKHGKSGGGLYADHEEYMAETAAKVANQLRTRYKEGIWDGTVDGLTSQTFDQSEESEGGQD